METDVGKASRWNTLRALRVLDWYGLTFRVDGGVAVALRRFEERRAARRATNSRPF